MPAVKEKIKTRKIQNKKSDQKVKSQKVTQTTQADEAKKILAKLEAKKDSDSCVFC